MTIVNLAWTAEIVSDADTGKTHVDILVGGYKLFATTLDVDFETSTNEVVAEALTKFDDFFTDVVERAEHDDLDARFERHTHATGPCEY